MSKIKQFTQSVEANDVTVNRNLHRLTVFNTDISSHFLILALCTSGSARALFDMRETVHKKNDIAILMPGHIVRPLECSDDYTYTSIGISRTMLENLRGYLFNHDYVKFHHHPIYSLTDLQVERLLGIVDQLEIIASHEPIEMTHRNHILLSLLSVGYEYLNYYLREQDKLLTKDKQAILFSHFCDLVVEHYREHKEIQYYAEQMDYHPKYLSRVIHAVTNGLSPRQWIEQYVMLQAQRLITADKKLSLKDIATLLGFTEASSFYRYFKRVSGMTAREYRVKHAI